LHINFKKALELIKSSLLKAKQKCPWPKIGGNYLASIYKKASSNKISN